MLVFWLAPPLPYFVLTLAISVARIERRLGPAVVAWAAQACSPLGLQFLS
jgi:hypothetical protein